MGRPMTLRSRTLLSIGLSLVCLVAILYGVARVSLLRSFAALEQEDIRQNLERATGVLTDDLSTLDHTASDYAAWDQTAAFVAGKLPPGRTGLILTGGNANLRTVATLLEA